MGTLTFEERTAYDRARSNLEAEEASRRHWQAVANFGSTPDFTVEPQQAYSKKSEKKDGGWLVLLLLVLFL